MERLPRKLALVAALLLAAYFATSREDAAAAGSVHVQTLQLVEEIPGHAQHRAFFSAALDAAHREAYAAAEAAGTRYGDDGFDDDAYRRTLFQSLSRQARRADLPALAANITAYGRDARGFGLAHVD